MPSRRARLHADLPTVRLPVRPSVCSFVRSPTRLLIRPPGRTPSRSPALDCPLACSPARPSARPSARSIVRPPSRQLAGPLASQLADISLTRQTAHPPVKHFSRPPPTRPYSSSSVHLQAHLPIRSPFPQPTSPQCSSVALPHACIPSRSSNRQPAHPHVRTPTFSAVHPRTNRPCTYDRSNYSQFP